MISDHLYKEAEKTAHIMVRRMIPGCPEEEQDAELLIEHYLDVAVNGKLLTKLVCTPIYLEELVFGYLKSENITDEMGTIELLKVDENHTRAEVTLEPGEKKIPSMQVLRPVSWQPAWIMVFDDLFQKDMPLHIATHSTHSCFLSYHGKIVFSCEDIGRHNALDKSIGYVVKYNLDLSCCILYTTGRVPVDVVLKVIRAGIPILATKETPTKNATELAQEYGLTLIGRIKNGQMILYS